MTVQTATLTQPKQIESEQIILGSCLQFQEAVDFVWAKLDLADFYDERHRFIFREIRKLASEEAPINLKTVKDGLQKENKLDTVGIEYLASLPDGIPRIDTLQYYINEVRKASRLRQEYSAAKNYADAIVSGNGEIESAKTHLFRTLLHPDSEGKPEHQFEQVSDNRYKLAIPETRISIEIDRLRRDSSELIGELCVRCSLPGTPTYDGALSIADFNLSSARARSDRAKLLRDRSNLKEIDWTGYLEELCQRVLSAERSGQPAVDLRQIERPDPDDTLRIEGLSLPRRHPSILFGDGGAAKSYLALYLAGCLAQHGLSIALFDWELAGGDHRDRLQRLFGPIMPMIWYARCERPLIYEADRLKRIVQDHSIDYAIYDSVAFACSGPPESAEIAGQYFRAVRQIGSASLHIAHMGKAEGSDQKPFGSVFWWNGARSIWYAQLSDSSTDGNTLQIGLFSRKTNLSRLHSVTGFEIRFDQDRTWFTRSDPSNTPELAEKMTIRQRMMSLLKGGAMEIEAISEALDAKSETIKRTVRRSKSLFMLIEGGKVGLCK